MRLIIYLYMYIRIYISQYYIFHMKIYLSNTCSRRSHQRTCIGFARTSDVWSLDASVHWRRRCGAELFATNPAHASWRQHHRNVFVGVNIRVRKWLT